MVKRVKLSDRDVSTLERLREHIAPGSAEQQPEDYRDKVVVKPWGYEFLIFQNEHVAIWYLHLGPGHSTSMHCHPGKKTALTILSGEALCSTFETRLKLKGIDSVVIEKGVFHSTKALSDDGIRLIEIESPPCKVDLVRLNDGYGRQARGYEGLSEMVTSNLAAYRHFYFSEPAGDGTSSFQSDNYEIELIRYCRQEEFKAAFRIEPEEYCCSCRGSILDDAGKTVLALGDMQKGAFFNGKTGLKIDGELLLMIIRPKPPGGEK